MTNLKEFAKAATIRAIRTIAQTAISLIGVGAVLSDINWLQVGSAALLAGILSILTSVATGLPETQLAAKLDAAEHNEQPVLLREIPIEHNEQFTGFTTDTKANLTGNEEDAE